MAKRNYSIPLGGAYTTRQSAVNVSDTTSGYVGVGIVGLMIVGKANSSTSKDARFINCFTQTVNDSSWGHPRKFVVKRPGWATSNTPQAGSIGNQILIWTGSGSGTSVITSFGSPNSTIYNGTTSLGTITGKCTGISETFVGTTATLLFSSDDNTGWYYDTGVGTVTKIVDADFPGNAGFTLAGTFSNKDGFAIISTTDGKIWASDLNSVTSWTANSFDSANSYPDMGVGSIRCKNYVMTFGTESTQFWYNAGLTPFPLACTQTLTAKIGCVGAQAIAQLADTVFWAGSTPQGGISIFQYDNSIMRVSIPQIDAILQLAGASNISITTTRFFGYSFVLVKASSTTLVYCIEEKSWHEWNSTVILWTKCAGVSLGGTMVNYAVSNVSTSGKVYVMNHASLVFTDDTMTYSARIQTAQLDEGSNNTKFYDYMQIFADIESSTSILTISATDDDYQTYQTLGTVDLSLHTKKITRLGSSDRRAWVFTHSANTPMRLEKAQGTLTIGTT